MLTRAEQGEPLLRGEVFDHTQTAASFARSVAWLTEA